MADQDTMYEEFDPLAETPEAPEGAEQPQAEAEDDFEIEVVDDTPPEDRGKQPLKEPPEEVTDEEMEGYSEKVKTRINKLKHGYHDERRAREAAEREREAAAAYAQRIIDENNRLKEMVTRGEQAFGKTLTDSAQSRYEQAKAAYRAAYEGGDVDKVTEAQESMMAARIELERAKNFRPTPLTRTEIPVVSQPTAPAPDQRALQWKAQNSWFGSNDAMTGFALGLHKRLVESGVNATSDTYYDTLNSEVRKRFPEAFETAPATRPTARKPAPSVVSAPTRSTAPQKITLTSSQVQTAKRLGVPIKEYARQVALLTKDQA